MGHWQQHVFEFHCQKRKVKTTYCCLSAPTESGEGEGYYKPNMLTKPKPRISCVTLTAGTSISLVWEGVDIDGEVE